VTDWLLLADSELSDVRREGSALRLRFSAAAVQRRAGEEGTAEQPLHGFRSDVRLQLEQVSIDAWEPPLLGRIVSAQLRLDGQRVSELEVGAAARQGTIELELRLAHQAGLRLRAHSLQVAADDAGRFFESMAC
jgi:hypothetical protein